VAVRTAGSLNIRTDPADKTQHPTTAEGKVRHRRVNPTAVCTMLLRLFVTHSVPAWTLFATSVCPAHRSASRSLPAWSRTVRGRRWRSAWCSAGSNSRDDGCAWGVSSSDWGIRQSTSERHGTRSLRCSPDPPDRRRVHAITPRHLPGRDHPAQRRELGHLVRWELPFSPAAGTFSKHRPPDQVCGGAVRAVAVAKTKVGAAHRHPGQERYGNERCDGETPLKSAERDSPSGFPGHWWRERVLCRLRRQRGGPDPGRRPRRDR
jgi:hypothetical protein